MIIGHYAARHRDGVGGNLGALDEGLERGFGAGPPDAAAGDHDGTLRGADQADGVVGRGDGAAGLGRRRDGAAPLRPALASAEAGAR